MFEWLDQLIQGAMMAINQSSPYAMVFLFLVVALTELGIPFPFILDSVLFLSSYQSGMSLLQILFIIFIVFLGRQFGAAIIYWLTRLLGNAFIYWLGKRSPSIKNNWGRIVEQISTQAPMAIALTRVTGLLTLASVVSGAIGVRYTSFVLGVTLSAVIFDGSLVILGLLTKYGFQLLGFTPSTWHVVIGVIIVTAGVMVGIQYFTRKRSIAKAKDKEKSQSTDSSIEESSKDSK
jgi:membrane protein DedA with SNARE-associated domain